MSWKLIRTPVRHRKHVLESPQVMWRSSEMFTCLFFTKLIFWPRNVSKKWICSNLPPVASTFEVKTCCDMSHWHGKSSKNHDFLNVMKSDKDARETSKECSIVTTSDMEIIWDAHVIIFEKTHFLTIKWPETSPYLKWSGPNQAMGLLPFERAQKNILIRTLDDGFGGDLMCENFGQRGLRTVYWRTPCLAVWRPMRSWRRVLRTMIATRFSKSFYDHLGIIEEPSQTFWYFKTCR